MNAGKIPDDMHAGATGGLIAAHAVGGAAGVIGMFLVFCIVPAIIVGAVELWNMRDTVSGGFITVGLVSGIALYMTAAIRYDRRRKAKAA